MLSPFERDGNVYTYKNWQYEKDLHNESKREFALREVGTAYKQTHISHLTSPAGDDGGLYPPGRVVREPTGGYNS
jgi:hypothetical protein